ncbi:MAG: hypothetical protein DRJ57_01075 [Thermoprotei archaeon]|nr:MAG: hypothetical protein DRJ57_01075 [Thermoprotei archaeon]
MPRIGGRAVGVASLVALTLVWGTTFPAIKAVVSSIGFAYYVALRFGLATLLLMPVAARRAHELRRYLRPGAALGLLYFSGITLQGLGMEFTTASNAAFVTGLSVVMVYVIEVLLGAEKPSLELTGAVALATLGMYLLSLSGFPLQLAVGDLIVLVGALFWALQIIAVDRLSSGSLTTLLLMECGITAAAASTLSPLTGPLPLAELRAALPHLLYLALVCTPIANALQLYGQRWVRSVDAALIYLLEPVFAALFSFIFLGEMMTPRQAVGALLILTAMAVSSLRYRNADRQPLARG